MSTVRGTLDASWTAHQEVVAWERPGSRPPTLTRNEIHVWWADLDVPHARQQNLAVSLSGPERARAERLRFAHHRRRYAAGRGLLRELIGAYLDTDPAALRFRFGALGKPSLAQAGIDLCFNFSDSQRRGLFAFAWRRELGVDLECLDRQVNYERIAVRKFARTESRALLALPAIQRRDAFLACWTRKEGFGKAKGVGIRYPLDSVSLCADCAEPRLVIDDDGRNWRLEQIYPTAGHVGTVVYAGPAVRLRFFAVPDSGLGPRPGEE